MAEQTNKGFIGGDSRLRKSDRAAASRGDRDGADVERTTSDGTGMTSEERRAALRNEWVREVLPTPPAMEGYHLCWLSTTSSTDPIFRRQQIGYEPVKASEIPGFSSFSVKGGEFDGNIACNEMVLFKIPLERYNDLMTIYHYDMPNEEEGMLRETVKRDEEDRDGRNLAIVEGDGFQNLGKKQRQPTFA